MNLKHLLAKIEFFLLREVREKKSALGLIFLALLISGGIRYFFVFAIAVTLLPRDIYNKNIRYMLELPLSRSDLFCFSYIFGGLLIAISYATGAALTGSEAELQPLINIFVFFTAYYGIAMLSAAYGLDNVTIPLILLAIDFIIGRLGHYGQNAYALISPIYQANTMLSMLFSAAILALAWWHFVKGRNEKW